MSFTQPQGSSAPAMPEMRYSLTEGAGRSADVGAGVREQRQPPPNASKTSPNPSKRRLEGRRHIERTNSTAGRAHSAGGARRIRGDCKGAAAGPIIDAWHST